MSFATIPNSVLPDLSTMQKLRLTWWGKILAECDTEPTELIMGGFLKWSVGTWLFLPLDSFASSPTFSTLRELGQEFPEYFVAIALMSLGAAHMLILRNGNRTLRKYASFIGALIWFSLAFTFIWSNPAAFGAMLFLAAAICQGWCYIRLGR